MTLWPDFGQGSRSDLLGDRAAIPLIECVGGYDIVPVVRRTIATRRQGQQAVSDVLAFGPLDSSSVEKAFGEFLVAYGLGACGVNASGAVGAFEILARLVEFPPTQSEGQLRIVAMLLLALFQFPCAVRGDMHPLLNILSRRTRRPDGVLSVPSGKIPSFVYIGLLTVIAAGFTRALHLLPLLSWKVIWSVVNAFSVTPMIVCGTPGTALTSCRVAGVGSHATVGDCVTSGPVKMSVQSAGLQWWRCRMKSDRGPMGNCVTALGAAVTLVFSATTALAA